MHGAVEAPTQKVFANRILFLSLYPMALPSTCGHLLPKQRNYEILQSSMKICERWQLVDNHLEFQARLGIATALLNGYAAAGQD